jgi:hypothetical protein
VIALIVIVGLTLVAIVWRAVLHRHVLPDDEVSDAWRADHHRGRRDD